MGNLRLMALRVLDNEACSGYTLVKKIHEKTGWKPSYGSIYPMLDDMKKNGLLTVKEKGRSKVYSLTSEGKKQAEAWDEKSEEALSNLKENIKILAELCGQDVSVLMQYLERMKVDQNPLGDLAEDWSLFRDLVFSMSLSNEFQKNSPKIRKILKKAVSELKKL